MQGMTSGEASTDEQPLRDLWAEVLAGEAGGDPEAGVVRELSAHFDSPVEEVRRRCRDSKSFSREAWESEDRSTPDALVRYWNAASPVFGITMSHVKQVTGEHPPSAVHVAERLAGRRPGTLLDFGCGPGTAAIFFARLGWKVTASDVSSTMLEFAAKRAKDRGVDVTFLDGTATELPVGRFDVVTAFEVMAHVPDVPATLAMVRRSMTPDGLLYFNVYAPPSGPDTFSHLYEGNWPVVRHVRRAGFRRLPRVGAYYCYQKVERGRLGTAVVTGLDLARYNPAVTWVGNRVRAWRNGRS